MVDVVNFSDVDEGTIYRIVGNLSMVNSGGADLTLTACIVHTTNDAEFTAPVIATLQASQWGDRDSILWWGAFRLPLSQTDSLMVPIDVKGRRKVNSNDGLHMLVGHNNVGATADFVGALRTLLRFN